MRCYVHLLEGTTIATLARWGIKGVRTENPGVWDESGERKIAALGVHLRRSISSYGIGLNVNTDLRWFDRIVACGLVGKSVTSMEVLREEGLAEKEEKSLTLNDVGDVWVEEFTKGLYGENRGRMVLGINGSKDSGTDHIIWGGRRGRDKVGNRDEKSESKDQLDDS